MAVTIIAAELAAALRLGDTDEELAEATRLLAYTTVAITRHVPTAPDAVHNEAAIRLAGYLYDQPNAGRGTSYANALRNSGSASILLPYRIHSLGVGTAAVAEAQAAVGTAGNPVVSVAFVGRTLVVTLADGTSSSQELPIPDGGDDDDGDSDSGVDQTARDAAEAAQTAADAAQADATAATDALVTHAGLPNVHHSPPTVTGGGAPAAFQSLLAGETHLTTAELTMATIAASDLTAAKKYRVTGSVYVRAIADVTHDITGLLYMGDVLIAQNQDSYNPEGSTQGRFSMAIDRIITMATPAVAITLRGKEGTGDTIIARPPTGLIVMEVS